ncbi:MAG TPA: OmpA family protein [Myxococcales bacterium]|nr:OmpA family protein [Myxococcales bacterium]
MDWTFEGKVGIGLVAAAALGAGCAHQQVKATPVAPAPVAAAAAAPAPAQSLSAQEADDLERIFNGDVIHFSLDSADLSSDDTARLQKIANALQRHPEVKIRISGNCDERGTEDYNLALGQRRAAKAKAYLGDLGIDASRVDTISYGKDRPVASGHDESAWAQNRRDEFQRHGE